MRRIRSWAPRWLLKERTLRRILLRGPGSLAMLGRLEHRFRGGGYGRDRKGANLPHGLRRPRQLRAIGRWRRQTVQFWGELYGRASWEV